MTFFTSGVCEDDLWDIDPGAYMFRGRYLDRIMDEASAVNHFGAGYQRALISPPVMQAIIRPRFMAPARPLDVEFPPFTIYPDCFDYVDMNNEILNDVAALSERFEWYGEVDEGTPEEWLNSHIDETIVLRHIPLLPTHTDAVYFHAHHLDAFLRHAFRVKDGHQIFGKDTRQKPTLYDAYEF